MRLLKLALLLSVAACSQQPAHPSLVEAPPPKLAAWQPTLKLAETSLASGAPDMALKVTDQLLAQDPNNVGALDRRGDALAALDQPKQAELAYASALRLQPGDIDAQFGLARLRMADDAAAAEPMFAAVTVAQPRNGAAWNDLGIARDLQGKHAQAQEAYRQSLALQPTSAAVQVNLGVSLAMSGATADAVQLLRPFATAQGATPRVRQDLALALALDGRQEEARAILAQDMPEDQARRAVAGFVALRQ